MGYSRRVRESQGMARGPMKRDTEDQSHHINQSYGGYQRIGDQVLSNGSRGTPTSTTYTRIAEVDSETFKP